MACTALIRPARRAASAAAATTPMRTPASATSAARADTAGGAGRFSRWAAWSTRGTLSAAPAGMPTAQPARAGIVMAATSDATTWSGVKPSALLTPMSR